MSERNVRIGPAAALAAAVVLLVLVVAGAAVIASTLATDEPAAVPTPARGLPSSSASIDVRAGGR